MDTQPSSATPWSAVIPLRKGSKGFPGKNVRMLRGIPLYQHSVAQALQAGAERVVITTDIPEVLNQSLDPRVTMVSRPHDLCADDTPMAPVLLHVLSAASISGTVGLLQATSPMRSPNDIYSALALFAGDAYDVVMSVTEAERTILKWGFMDNGRFVSVASPSFCFMNRQNLPPVFRPNGAVYVFDSEWFSQSGGFEMARVGGVVMPSDRSLDIDTKEDFQRCELALNSQRGIPR